MIMIKISDIVIVIKISGIVIIKISGIVIIKISDIVIIKIEDRVEIIIIEQRIKSSNRISIIGQFNLLLVAMMLK